MKNATPIATSTACLLMASTAWALPTADFDWDASNDPNTANNLAEDVAGSGKNFTLPTGVTYNNTLTDAPSNISAVYTYAAGNSGGGGFNFDGSRSNNDASFEFLFRPTDNFGRHYIWEAGDSTGSGIFLNGNALHIGQTGSGGPNLVTAYNIGDIATTRGGQFIHVVGVMDLTNNKLLVYANGVLAASNNSYTANDWTGGNDSGLGFEDSGAGGRGALSTSLGYGNFVGDLAYFRVYESALSPTDVGDLYNAAGTFSAPPAGPISLLSTTFTDRTVNGATAGNIPWVTNGVVDPGDITVVEGNRNAAADLNGLFTSDGSTDHIAPNLNVNNSDDWSFDIALNPVADDIEIISIELDMQKFGSGGQWGTQNNSLDWVATITGSSSGQVATKTLTTTATTGSQLITFDSSVTLDTSESWVLNIAAEDNPGGNGFFAGIDGINVIGNIAAPIPEPSSLALLGLGGLLVARRRR